MSKCKNLHFVIKKFGFFKHFPPSASAISGLAGLGRRATGRGGRSFSQNTARTIAKEGRLMVPGERAVVGFPLRIFVIWSKGREPTDRPPD